MKEKLTQERLKELLDYNPETGVFTRKKGVKGANEGDIAGCLNKSTGYWIIGVDRKSYKAHRLAFFFMEGYLPENDIDHIDRNKTNNKWSNLREVSRSCNIKNGNVASNNKSGVKGICWDSSRKKWKVEIKVPRKINIGRFDNLIDAANARWEAEIKYKFPNCNTTSSAYNYLKDHGAI